MGRQHETVVLPAEVAQDPTLDAGGLGRADQLSAHRPDQCVGRCAQQDRPAPAHAGRERRQQRVGSRKRQKWPRVEPQAEHLDQPVMGGLGGGRVDACTHGAVGTLPDTCRRRADIGREHQREHSVGGAAGGVGSTGRSRQVERRDRRQRELDRRGVCRGGHINHVR